MKEIDININKAKILSYNVELCDEMPRVSATIGLYSGEKQVSTFSLRTESYYSNSIVFEVPSGMIPPILKIADELEAILAKTCVATMGQLPPGQ